MRGTKVAVFGTYRSPDDAEEAVGALIIKGFPCEAISALIPEDLASRTHRPEPIPVEADATRHLVEKEICSGTLGLLDHVSAISVPEVGLLIGAGPLMGALAGGAPLRGLAAAFQEMGAPVSEAVRYERALKDRAIVSVRCTDPEWAVRARQILTSAGAEHLSPVADSMDNVGHGSAPLH